MKTFKVAPGRTVVIPKSIAAGPGMTAARYNGGDTFTLTPAQAANRFIRNRVRIGDLVEVAKTERGAS